MNGLLFIRHAETNLAGTFCGHSDPPINARGEIQIDELIVRLKSESFDAIYASDLQRAVDTATSLAQAFAVPCTTTPNLREIYFGEWEGMTWTDIENRDADYARRWIEASPHLPAPQGETFAAFESRILQEVDRLRCIATDKRLAVVTHGGVMRMVLRNLMNYTEQQAWELTKPYCCFFSYTGTEVNR
jgi:broad specificity phosphatase PhoE